MAGAKKKICAYLLIGIVALAAVAFLVDQVSTRVSRRRAERLLHDLRQLQVGKSTFDEARAMVTSHGGGISSYDPSGCSPAHCTFDVVLHHYPLLIDVWGPMLSPVVPWQVCCMFPYLGLQDWQAAASVRVDGGVVTHVDYGVIVRASGCWVLIRKTDEFLEIPPDMRKRMGRRSYFVRSMKMTTLGGELGIESTITPEASDQERNRAYDFDFNCLTKLGGCSSLCQSAPMSVADLLKEPNHEPWLDQEDPNCAQFKSPQTKPPETPK